MNFENYETKIPCTPRPKRVCNSCNNYFKDGDVFCSKCGTNVKETYEKEFNEFKENVQERRNDEARLWKQFKYDLLKEADLLNHPKKDNIIKYLEMECDGNMREMYNTLENMIDYELF